tara:strand:+ start:79 stop:321 length:243 start_codon:yes stop_codon:yes gene_type:complete
MYSKVNIYCITDCNGLKYVGSTRSDIRHRLANHTYEKKKGRRKCESHKLDLENCEIEVLEVCEPKDSKLRLKYWTDTMNQ